MQDTIDVFYFLFMKIKYFTLLSNLLVPLGKINMPCLLKSVKKQ